MFYTLARWYIQHNLKKENINTLELVIRSDGWTFYKRNKEREESIKKLFTTIK